jgi:hypothetical protein
MELRSLYLPSQLIKVSLSLKRYDPVRNELLSFTLLFSLNALSLIDVLI